MKAALLMLLVLAGCGSLSARDRDELARLPTLTAGVEGEASKLTSIDGQSVGDTTYKLWPGRHRVVIVAATPCPQCSVSVLGSLVGALPLLVSLPIILVAEAIGTDESPKPVSVASGPLTKCFVARTGHAYHVRADYQQGTWSFAIIDQTTSRDVSSSC